jgi:hypothetical protein
LHDGNVDQQSDYPVMIYGPMQQLEATQLNDRLKMKVQAS